MRGLENVTRKPVTILCISVPLRGEVGRMDFAGLHQETHSESRNQSIYDVAESCSDSCDEAIPAPFVQCTLNAKHSDWSHGSGCHHADEQSLYD